MDWKCGHSGTYNDRWLIEEVFPGKTDGSYIEIGLGHPELESATYLLEQMGWSGVSFEPNPDLYAICKPARLNPVVHAAVWTGYGWSRFRMPAVEPYRSGIEECRNEKQIANDLQVGYQTTWVTTIPFSAVLALYCEIRPRTDGRFWVDAICIDAENAEYPILKQFDPKVYAVGAWTIESSRPARLHKLMASYGYREVTNPFNQGVRHEHYFLPEESR